MLMELDDGWNFLHEAAARLSGHTSSSSSAVAGSGGAAAAAAAAAAASGGSSAIRMGENVRVPHTAKAAAEQLWETTQQQQQQQQQQHDDDVDVWDEAEKQRDLQWEAGMKVCSLIADGLGWSLLFE